MTRIQVVDLNNDDDGRRPRPYPVEWCLTPHVRSGPLTVQIMLTGVALALVILTVLAFAFARALRRDVDERFQRVQADLERQAEAIVRRLLDADHRT